MPRTVGLPPLSAASERHSAETERAVVACVLVEPLMLEQVCLQLDPEDLRDPAARRVLRAAVRIANAGLPVDSRTLQEDLDRHGELAAVGGVAGLVAMEMLLPDLGACDSYCRIVRRDSIARQVAHGLSLALSRIAQVEDPGDVRDEIGQAYRLLDEAIAVDVGEVTLSGMLEAALARYEALRSGHRAPGLTTGFPSIDAALVGIAPRDLIIIGGYAGKGKTTLVEQLVRRWAHAGEHPLMVSLEMGHDQSADRHVASVVRTSLPFVRKGQFDLGGLRSWLADPANLEVSGRVRYAHPRTRELGQVLAAVHAIHRRRRASVVVIDHLHRLVVPGLDRRLEVDQAVRALKQLAIELEAPVIAPAQISRAGVRGDAEPELHNLAESGTIEQEADGVLLYHRPDHGMATLRLAKARQGEEARAELTFDARTRQLTEIARGYHTPAPAPPPRRQAPLPTPAAAAAAQDDPF